MTQPQRRNRKLALAIVGLICVGALVLPNASAYRCYRTSPECILKFDTVTIPADQWIHPGTVIRFGGVECSTGFVTWDAATSDYEIITAGTCVSSIGQDAEMLDENLDWVVMGDVVDFEQSLGHNWALIEVRSAYDDNVCGKIEAIGGPTGEFPSTFSTFADYAGFTLSHFMEPVQWVFDQLVVTQTSNQVNHAVDFTMSDINRGGPIITSQLDPFSKRQALGILNDIYIDAEGTGVIQGTLMSNIPYGNLLTQSSC